ncbi:hypothetical protein HDU86_006291 [Geranomyces michiganensis]|nr:hypothetical protein HDU86_006291 [Geranomyces michiganensis]
MAPTTSLAPADRAALDKLADKLGTGPVQPTGPNKRFIMVAKKFPPDLMGEVAHTLLGDAQDFEAMERELEGYTSGSSSEDGEEAPVLNADVARDSTTTSGLLMARLGEYRERLEAHELVETALRLLDEEHVDFWKMGLRLGSDLLGLTMPIPRGGPRQIERVRTYEERTRTKSAVGRRHPPNAKADMYGDIISLFDPFYSHGDSGYLALEGHNSVTPSRLYSLAHTYVSALDTRTCSPAHFANEESVEEQEDEANSDDAAAADAKHLSSAGPQLMLAVNRLAFRVVLDQVDTSVLTVYNRGSTACKFEWVKIQRPNPLGIFTEQWELRTTPLLESQPVLTLQGIAVAVDNNAAKRRALEAKLIRAQALTTAKATIESLLSNIKPRAVSARSLRRLANTRDEQTFVKRNKELGLIAQISDADTKSAFLRRLNSLINAAGMKPSETIESLLRVIAHDSLSALAEDIVEISDTLRRRFQLPLTRSANRFDQGDAPEGEVPDGQAAAQQQPQAQAPVSQPLPLPAAQEPANARKATPPVGTAGEEKGGKKAGWVLMDALNIILDAEPAPVRAPLVLAKVTVKQKKPDSSRGWTRERKLAEEAYRAAFKAETRKAIGGSFTRMCELFEDAGSAF